MLFSNRMEDALTLAAKAHIKQYRKGTNTPYITHPFHVALILFKCGYRDEDVLISAILHDVIEDANISLDEIGNRFGEKVKVAVHFLTEEKHSAVGPIPWVERKRNALKKLAAGSSDIVAIKAADTLHNAITLLNDIIGVGPCVWERFNSGADQIIENYSSVLEIAREKGINSQITEELGSVINELKSKVP